LSSLSNYVTKSSYASIYKPEINVICLRFFVRAAIIILGLKWFELQNHVQPKKSPPASQQGAKYFLSIILCQWQSAAAGAPILTVDLA